MDVDNPVIADMKMYTKDIGIANVVRIFFIPNFIRKTPNSAVGIHSLLIQASQWPPLMRGKSAATTNSMRLNWDNFTVNDANVTSSSALWPVIEKAQLARESRPT